uniref:Uncharacterized protein n=1 Tax=Anopheles atroparvus TaxID=41427 RepID=A0A182JBK2_ANOAO
MINTSTVVGQEGRPGEPGGDDDDGSSKLCAEPIASHSSSSTPSPSLPILRLSASCVWRSISRMSSIESPYHSSCQAQACRCARSIVLRKAVSWMNFSSLVCIPQ